MIYTFQSFSSDFKNTTVCNTLHQWKYLWKGLLSLLCITYQNNLEKFPFSSMYFHGFCSKPKIHQLMYRLHDASCPHPLAHLDLSPKATWPRAHTQSRWGYQPKGSTTRLISPIPIYVAVTACTAPPTVLWKKESETEFVILTLLILEHYSHLFTKK